MYTHTHMYTCIYTHVYKYIYTHAGRLVAYVGRHVCCIHGPIIQLVCCIHGPIIQLALHTLEEMHK